MKMDYFYTCPGVYTEMLPFFNTSKRIHLRRYVRNGFTGKYMICLYDMRGRSLWSKLFYSLAEAVEFIRNLRILDTTKPVGFSLNELEEQIYRQLDAAPVPN